MKFPTLYKRATTGKIQEWTIVTNGNKYYTISGQVGGKLTTTKPSFGEPKNVGKSNESTAEEQSETEANAKWEYKLAHGYTEDITATDSTGYREPMLAKLFKDYSEVVVYPVCVDDKLNGMRCNAKKDTIRSRKNKDIHTVPHLVRTLKPLFDKYPNLFLDGELFNPALKNKLGRLIELTSVAYQPKDVTPELLKESEQIVQFHIYDGFGFEDITENTPFVFRREALHKLLKGIKYVKVLDYIPCKDEAEITKLLLKAKAEKREGLIVRWGDCAYEHKRSKYLLKVKNWVTEEFPVVEVQEGDGDWAGCAKRVVLRLPKPVIGRDGKVQETFAAGIEGDMEYCRKLFKNKDKVVGKQATVTYGELSEYGIPLTPVMEVIRDYE